MTTLRIVRAGPAVLLSLLWVLLGLFALSLPARAAEDFLPADEAFVLRASLASEASGPQLVVEIDIAPKTYLYRDRTAVVGLSAEVKLGALELPPGQRKFDETFGKEVEVYHGLLMARAPLDVSALAGRAGHVKITYQGCAEAGLCYPPQNRYFRVVLGAQGQAMGLVPSTEAQAQAAGGGAPGTAAPTVRPVAETAVSAGGGSAVDRALASGSLWQVVGVFFVAGLLLSFTPCVLPMLPILSSVIVGEGDNAANGDGQGGRPRISRLRGLSLALSYSQGMALVYTLLGVAAGLLGEGLAAWLQNPWVLGAFAALLVLLALAMFGAYELQMPAALQTRLSHHSGRARRGSLVGVFVMGAISALIVGPCVTAPLAGGLLYISQTRDVVLGGAALYAMAWGMSVPLLLLGLSAGALLPRVGPWMESVKAVFGMLLLGVAWWLVSPVLPAWAVLGLLGVWLALGAALLGAFDTIGAQASVRHRAFKGLGWVLAVLAGFQLVGAVTGASSPWAPLSPLTDKLPPVTTATTAATAPGLPLAGTQPAAAPASAEPGQAPFKRVTTLAALDAALADAQAQGRTALVDFYADWCVACKEMEHLTFTDPQVRAHLANAALVQVDVTQANGGPLADEARALLKRFGLFGPPGIIFFNAQGQEMPGVRVIGFQKPEVFIRSLQAAGL